MRTTTLLSLLPLLASTALALPQPVHVRADTDRAEVRRRLQDREHRFEYITRYHTEWADAQPQATGDPSIGDNASPYSAAADSLTAHRNDKNQAQVQVQNIDDSFITAPQSSSANVVNAAPASSDDKPEAKAKGKGTGGAKKNGKCRRPKDHRHALSADADSKPKPEDDKAQGRAKASDPKVSPEPQPSAEDKPVPSNPPAPAPEPAPTPSPTVPADDKAESLPSPSTEPETKPEPEPRLPAPSPTEAAESKPEDKPAPDLTTSPADNKKEGPLPPAIEAEPEPEKQEKQPAPPAPPAADSAPEPEPAKEEPASEPVKEEPLPMEEPPAPVNNAASGAGATPGSPVGLAVNGRLPIDVASFGSGLGWYYDWDVKPQPGYEALEFVPMLHGRDWVRDFKPEQLNGAKYALSFNEPNIAATPEDGGSGMSASEAADLHKKWTAMAPADVKIGSISPSRGGSGFFKEWYDACGGESCRMDFVTFHFYGMNIDALKAEVELYKPYGKPIWVTEVACREYREDSPNNWVLHHCTNEERDKLMSDMITYFNGEPQVERWAWFGAVSELVTTDDENSIVDREGKANDLGKQYAANQH